ncbi:MAG: OmpA family protein [Pseudomonadota bacterium]
MTQPPTFSRRHILQGAGAVGIGSLASLIAPSVMAQSFSANSYGDETTDLINRLIQDLAPKQPTESGLPIGGPKTRKVLIRLPDGTTRVYWVDYDSSASLSVQFRTDSAKISQRSRSLLRVLATALKSEKLSTYTYMLAGHTDARASEAYNQDLSERRAGSVAIHLNSVHAISRKRLLPVGFGETQLANPSAPKSGVNRRVEVGLIVRPPNGQEGETPTSGSDTNSLIGQ